MAAITNVPGLILAKNQTGNTLTLPAVQNPYNGVFPYRSVLMTCDNPTTSTAIVSVQYSLDGVNAWTQLSSITGSPVSASYNPTTPSTTPVIQNYVIANTPGMFLRCVVTEGNTTSVKATNLNVVIL